MRIVRKYTKSIAIATFVNSQTIDQIERAKAKQNTWTPAGKQRKITRTQQASTGKESKEKHYKPTLIYL